MMRTTDNKVIKMEDLVKGFDFTVWAKKGYQVGYNFIKVTYTKDFTDKAYFDNYVNKITKNKANFIHGEISDGLYRVAFITKQFINVGMAR